MKHPNFEMLKRVVRGEEVDVPVERRTVAIVVFYDAEGNVLLQDMKSISKAGEKWGLFGGGIENGETPVEGLKRELSEEVSGFPDGLNFKKLAEMRTVYYNELKKNGYRDLYKHIFSCKIPIGTVINVIEGDGAKWFSYDEAKKQKMIHGNAEAIELAKVFADGKDPDPKIFTQNGYRGGFFLKIKKCD